MRVLDCNYFISNNKSGKKFFYWQIRLQLIFINFKIRLKIQSLITHKIRQFYGDELLQRSRLRLMSLNSFAVSLSCLDTRQKKNNHLCEDFTCSTLRELLASFVFPRSYCARTGSRRVAIKGDCLLLCPRSFLLFATTI